MPTEGDELSGGRASRVVSYRSVVLLVLVILYGSSSARDATRRHVTSRRRRRRLIIPVDGVGVDRRHLPRGDGVVAPVVPHVRRVLAAGGGAHLRVVPSFKATSGRSSGVRQLESKGVEVCRDR